MDKATFLKCVKQAIDENSLLTHKHDPSSVGESFERFRSVLSPQAAENIADYLSSGNYEVDYYTVVNGPNKSGAFVVKPDENAPFDVPGSGIYAYDSQPSVTCDSFKLYYGKNRHWHIMAEEINKVQQYVKDGKYIDEGQLH